MFETFEQKIRPQSVESEKTETEKEKNDLREFFIEAICIMRNAIAQLEGERERLSYGSKQNENEEAIKVCRVKKALIEEVLTWIKKKAGKMGVALP